MLFGNDVLNFKRTWMKGAGQKAVLADIAGATSYFACEILIHGASPGQGFS